MTGSKKTIQITEGATGDLMENIIADKTLCKPKDSESTENYISKEI